LNPFVSPPILQPAKLRCGGSTPEVLMEITHLFVLLRRR
jgi:hypothetical protein